MGATDEPADSRIMPMHCDSVEFCPVDGSEDLMAVSMYQLEEDTTRIGAIQLYQVAQDEYASFRLQELSMLQCSGVFDLKWRHSGGADGVLAASALADGTCLFVKVPDAATRALSTVASAAGAGGSGMTVSCDWDPFDSTSVLCSSSSGQLTQTCLREAVATTVQTWRAHDLEAWIVAADRHQEGVVYSGADDCAFKGWDTRQTGAPAFCNRREHAAGVCCIHSHPSKPYTVGTGSYDEQARVWDTRFMERPLLQHKVSVGGGVWRFKWHPHKPELALLACMHNGFAVVEASESELTVRHEYAHQKSLGYGADWWWGGCGNSDQRDLVGTCSFYDKTLHIWQPSPGV